MPALRVWAQALGKCPACAGRSCIRHCTTRPAQPRSWTASPDLLAELFRHARLLLTPLHTIVCRGTRSCAEAKLLRWAALNGTLGSIPQHLVGPFCGRCWGRVTREWFREGEEPPDLDLYQIRITPSLILGLEETRQRTQER